MYSLKPSFHSNLLLTYTFYTLNPSTHSILLLTHSLYHSILVLTHFFYSLAPYTTQSLYSLKPYTRSILLLTHTVILLIMDGPDVRETMLAAYHLGYVNGDYAFIAFNSRRSGYLLPEEDWKQVCN